MSGVKSTSVYKPWVDDKDEIIIENLTVAEYAIIDSLIARVRLGESRWSLPKKLKSTLEKMQHRGILSIDSHVMQGWLYVTPSQRLLNTITTNYLPPVLKSLIGDDSHDIGRLYEILQPFFDRQGWVGIDQLVNYLVSDGRVLVVSTPLKEQD